jgi:uncharacterized cupin superfamily protein
MRMPNVFEPEFDSEQERHGFTCRRAQLGRRARAERLGASVFEIPPRQATFPYHQHTANEEMLVVLVGRPSLRTLAGERELAEGEVVAFPVGERGAHQVVNRSDDAVRVLMFSEMNAPEVNRYPDTDKVMAMTRPPGGRGPGDAWGFQLRHAVDYWEGEVPPGEGR